MHITSIRNCRSAPTDCLRRAALILLTALLMLNLVSCGAVESEIDRVSTVSQDDSDWDIADFEPLVMENDRVCFSLDPVTTHFSVTDKSTGTVYHSVPDDAAFTYSSEDSQRMESELTVTYYESQSSAYYFYSTQDSVNLEQAEVRYSDDTVRVYYTFGSPDRFVPLVLDQATFENEIVAQLSGARARKIKRYYTLYDRNDPEDDFEQMKDLYPILAKENLYILDAEMVNDNEMTSISEYMDEVGYTQETYDALLAKLSIQPEETAGEAGFRIPIEYTLTPDGFTASVLTDLITEYADNYYLQSVALLEYFACSADTEKGSFVVPDGSGSVIDFNTGDKGNYEQPFYGMDQANKTYQKDQLSQQLTLPIFGISRDDGGVLAIVETAAEEAVLHVAPAGSANPLNHAYADFTLRKMESTEQKDNVLIPVYNIFSPGLLEVSPTVRYALLTAEQCDYSAMAAYYRTTLQNNGTLQASEHNAPLYLEFLCKTTSSESFLGIPYEKDVILSKISDIQNIVETLHKKGISPIVVRLTGYGSDGLENGPQDRFTLSSGVGTTEELLQLASFLEENNGRLYLDSNPQFVYKNTVLDGFSEKQDSSHHLDRTLVYNGHYDIVTREYNKSTLPRFFVSASNYPSYTRSFIRSIQKKLGTPSVGLSVGTLGAYLGGDYASRLDFDRSQSLAHVQKSLVHLQEAEYPMMADVGNGYVLPYVQDLLHVSLGSSAFDIEATQVPFYQMVVHGSLPYAGNPINFSGDPNNALLRMVEYGASPYLLCCTVEDNSLSDTPYEGILYSLSAQERLDTYVSLVQPALEGLQDLSGVPMEGYREIAPSVYRTSYANGHGVLVNYGTQDVTIKGSTVPAGGYCFY